jgi:Zn-dependent protease
MSSLTLPIEKPIQNAALIANEEMIVHNIKYISIWLAIPILFAGLYPWAVRNPEYLRWLIITMLMVVLFFSVVIHELSHGLAARACGDHTAERAGRLTLNPIRHVSIFGSLVLPIVLYLMKAPVFGWAKPVPFDATNLKEYPRDQVWIAMAGPLSNLGLSFVCYLIYLFSAIGFRIMNPGHAIQLPLDIFTPLPISGAAFEALWFVWLEMLAFGLLINLVLAIFNLLPFPPLDGSWILKALLPPKALKLFSKIQPFGFLLILIALRYDLLTVCMYPLMMVAGAFNLLGNWAFEVLP